MRETERDQRLSPRAQLGLSVEFRNGMLTAHPDPSSSSQQRRRGGPNAAGIFGSSLQESFHSLHMIYHTKIKHEAALQLSTDDPP